MRSRISSGRFRRSVYLVLLLIAGAFVMFAGLLAIVVLVGAGVAILAVLYAWSVVRRLFPGPRIRPEPPDQSGDGVTLEGEYSVEHRETGRHEDQR
ncbi:MAG: hypothetical protein ACRETQ_07155 [Gammaproteobacteria bacterium]